MIQITALSWYACALGWISIRLAHPDKRLMLNALRYYWIIAKGYRLRPWASPYIQWRLETFFGKDAAGLDARQFIRLLWRERSRMKRFLDWVAERRSAQHSKH